MGCRDAPDQKDPKKCTPQKNKVMGKRKGISFYLFFNFCPRVFSFEKMFLVKKNDEKFKKGPHGPKYGCYEKVEDNSSRIYHGQLSPLFLYLPWYCLK